MTNPWINFLALAFYIAATALLALRLARGSAAAGGARLGILAIVAGAAILHGALLYMRLGLEGGLDLGLTSALSLVALAVVLVFLIGALARPIENTGLLALPIAAVTVFIEWLWPSPPLLREASGFAALHIVVSLLAYGLLTLASAQALLLYVRERRLRHRQPGGFVIALPPLQTMETLMFQLIGAGFVLLSLTLVSGIGFSEQVFGKPFRLNHHVVLSALAWVVYGTLLIGHWRLGWRGRPALRWTLGGFTLLVLGYFGSKFVLEILLKR